MADLLYRGTQYVRDSATLWRGAIGGVLLLPSGAPESWYITTPGDVIWDLLVKPYSIDQLVKALSIKFHEPSATVFSDIELVMRTLHEIGAIRSF